MNTRAASARFTLPVEIALLIDLGLVWVESLFPGSWPLPLGGGHVAQLSIVAVPLIVVVEGSHCTRRCLRSVKAWWSDTDPKV